MNDRYTLTATIASADRVRLSLCMFLYEVCNDVQFEYMTGSDFVNFLNLKPTSAPVTVLPRENLRVCYLVHAISRTITPKREAARWAECFLQQCGIEYGYYYKHCHDVASHYASPANKEFARLVDTVLQRDREFHARR